MSVCQKLSRPDGNFVPIKQSDMRLIDFMQVFPDEESCGRKLREYREAQGVVCPHCGGKEHYWKGDKKCFECKRCHYRQGLKANTVMHGSQLPLRYWFITMHLLTSTKKSFSTEAPDSEKDKPLKRGHGSQKKTKVLVLAETAEGTPAKKSDKPTKVKYIKMIVIDNLKAETIDGKVKMYVNPNSTITSDDSKSYTNFKSLVKEHVHQVIEPAQVGKILPWVHIAIGNAKRLLLDVYHDITPDYLQNYLNEFCYKFNRRRFGDALFDRLMVAALAYKNDFRYNIA